MRIKIIAVNALIVTLVGLLSFLLVRSAIGSATSNKNQLTAEVQNDVNGAAGWLQLDGLRAERWLAAAASEQATLDALTKASPSARGDAATKRCDDLVSKMKNASLFERNVPTLVALVDSSGKIVGRNSSNLNRGDDMAATYPGLKSTLTSGQSGSDVWYQRDRYLASYVVVHDEQGKVIGALVIGRPLNDTLSRVSEATTGRALIVVVPKRDGFDIVGHSQTVAQGLDDSVSGAAKDMLKNALSHQQTENVRDGDLLVAASPLVAFEDGKHVLLVAAAPAALIQDPTGLAMVPIFGAAAVGIILVVVGGWLLGNYITRPINMLEEGLLAILNGQTEKRFELDHAELGGLAFRIDQLLNQLMGVEEDTTDDEGRVSMAPNAANFTDALAVDDKRMMQPASELTMDPESIRALAAEPAPQYYARIYQEYIAAKRAIGEATDHITEQAFAARIQGMEQDAAQKYGRPVRYQVQARNREVVLLAVPL
jgi:methyl-accepting chemotaxis protein